MALTVTCSRHVSGLALGYFMTSGRRAPFFVSGDFDRRFIERSCANRKDSYFLVLNNILPAYLLRVPLHPSSRS